MAPKKKLSKKEKARLEAEQAELLRIEQEKLRLQQLEEEKERQQREQEEAEKRQKQEIIENKLRRKQLKASCLYLNEFKDTINSLFAEQRKKNEWEQFMRCNGLPNARDPGELRQYIHMWKESIKQLNESERNWLLKTNERTLLTQNRAVPNLTTAHVKSFQQNMGTLYASRIKEILGIMNELQEAILNPEDLSQSIQRDLLRLRTELRFNLATYIDEFAYKILCNIDRDMEIDSSIIATHSFESEIFNSQLWTQRDIPQPQLTAKEKAKEESRHINIEFDLLGISLVLPPTIKSYKAALRGLWLKYDHFSDTCHTYSLPFTAKPLKSLKEETRAEWKKRKELLQSAQEQTVVKETESVPFDGLEMPTSNVIDVDKLFTEFEDEQNRLEKKRKGPAALKLRPSDVNLRSHRIVGGVVCIDYVEQPKQDVKISSKTYLTIISQPNQLIRKSFFQSYKPPPPPQPGVRRLPEEIEAEIKLMEQSLDKLALITVQLPEDVLWFEPPLVCRWETPDETLQSDREESGKLESPSKENIPKSCAKRPSIKSQRSPTVQRKQIEDFDLLFIPARIDLYAIMNDYVLPRLPNGYGIIIQSGSTDRKGSLLKYSIKEDSDADQGSRKSSKFRLDFGLTGQKTPNSLDSLLLETNSPRPLFPKTACRKALHIIPKQKRKIEKLLQLSSSSSEEKSDADESVRDEPATANRPLIKGKWIKARKQSTSGRYLFSTFLKDLDELNESQKPNFEQLLEEILSNFSQSPVDDLQESNLSRKYSTISILRQSRDLMKEPSFLGKSIDIIKISVTEETTSESEESETEEDQSHADDQCNGENSSHVGAIGNWSTRDVHDVKFNEDKLTIQFRTGRLGTFGFAANRYSNVPYQTWELKPEMKSPNTVIFTLTASVVSIDVTITSDGVRLNALQGCSLTPLQHILGVTMSLQNLKKIMKNAAIDLFPDEDAFCYTEGSCEKNAVMESHLYSCVGALALTHNFSWSRWNLLSGSRTSVLLMRELIENKKLPPQSTLLVTPLKACVVDCTEVSASFNTNGVSGMEFYADLHHLALAHSQPVSLIKQQNMNPLLRENVFQILKSTRPLSFC